MFQLIFVVFVVIATLSEHRTVAKQVCDKTNGCFKWPHGCNIAECKAITQFKVLNKSHMSITISGKTDGWIAFGINDKPRTMGGVKGEVCMKSSTGVSLKSFENKETDFNLKSLHINISSSSATYKDGKLSCIYTRSIKASALQDISQPYFLITSWGKTKMKGSEVHAHEHETGDYFWSKEKVILTSMGDIQVTTFGWSLIAVHGSLMVIAWIGFGFSAIFYARHVRKSWKEKKICGSALWFQVHRVSFFICTTLVIIAFIIILAEAGGWNSEMEGHPVLGMITIVLVCLQVVAGIARPALNSSKRIVFKYAHRMTGAVTYILAVITIFLGLAAMEVDLAVLILYMVLIIVIFVGHEAFNFYQSRTAAEVPYRGTELESVEDESSNSEETITYSARGAFARKTLALLVAGLGVGMAVILCALIAHKGYVYHKKGISN